MMERVMMVLALREVCGFDVVDLVSKPHYCD
jgi:hypothetical protein